MRPLFVIALGLLALFGSDAVRASDLPTKAPPMARPASGDPWNGFYLGVNGGGALGHNPTSNPQIFGPVANFPVAGLDSYTHAPAGGLIGGQVGWNWRAQTDWVLGAEADLQWLHQSDAACISECLPLEPGTTPGLLLGLTDSESMTWLGTARLRAGWIAPNNTLLYATAGAAWSRSRTRLRCRQHHRSSRQARPNR
jgi:outer membrane immunogenic protein